MNFGDERLPARFWDKTIPEPMSGCWLWIGTVAVVRGGYGLFNVNGKTWRAHRLAFIVLVGKVSSKVDLDHLCRVTSCVNPAHLQPVTRRENVRRGAGYGGVLHKPKTHCVQGHELVDENIYLEGKSRKCRRRTRIQNFKARERAAAQG